MDGWRMTAKISILRAVAKFVKRRLRPPRFSSRSTLSQEAAWSKVRV